MSVLERIENQKKRAHEKVVATKILDNLEKLFMENNDTTSKRWIWELMQNAKDSAYVDQKVKIKINFNQQAKKLEFSHNSQPFTLEGITFLIEQVSTKDRSGITDGIKTTGKFGTGFLTTHLLSSVVDLDSVLADEGILPTKFELTLDRSGKDPESILTSIENSLKQISQIDGAKSIEIFDKQLFNTKFTYTLDQKGLKIAEQGLADFKFSIFYVLIFMQNIQSVMLEHEQCEYCLSEKAEELQDGLNIYTIDEIKKGTKK